MVLKGEGMPVCDGPGFGNLFVKFSVLRPSPKAVEKAGRVGKDRETLRRILEGREIGPNGKDEEEVNGGDGEGKGHVRGENPTENVVGDSGNENRNENENGNEDDYDSFQLLEASSIKKFGLGSSEKNSG